MAYHRFSYFQEVEDAWAELYPEFQIIEGSAEDFVARARLVATVRRCG